MTDCRIPASAPAMKKSSKNRVLTAICSLIVLRFINGSSSLNASPSIIFTKVSTPTARTNGSANGSSRRGSGPWDATARDAATAVAVAPTLDARSQVSLSVRAISNS
jgi:hypothetical protein